VQIRWIGVLAAAHLVLSAGCGGDEAARAPLRARHGDVVAPPRGRATTPPGAERCTVHVDWSQGIEYPALPARADGPVRFGAHGVSIAVSLIGATDAPARDERGVRVHDNALPGGDLLRSLQPNGFEDFVYFARPPAERSIAYRVALGEGAAALRLVENTLEILDAQGAPRLRAHAPWVMGSERVHVDASLSVEGCAVDRSPAAPWGRSLVAPGARTCVVRVSWPDTKGPLLVDPLWSTTGSMAAPRSGHTAVRLASGKVLVAAGGVPGTSSTAEVYLSTAELYDPTSGSWATTGSLAQPRKLHVGALSGSRVLVAGGSPSYTVYHSTAESYDPDTGLWSSAGTMSVARNEAAAAALAGGEVLVTGGRAGITTHSTVEKWTPPSTWTSVGSLAGSRVWHTATTLPDGRVLVAAGDAPSYTAEVFSPSTNAWTSAGTMLGDHRRDATAALLPGGKVLIVGGNDNTFEPEAEVWDPSTGAWSEPGKMVQRRYRAATAVLADGRVLMTGGQSIPDKLDLTSAEIYDPVTNSWSNAGSFSTKRLESTLTPLSDGRVLLAGGYYLSLGLFAQSSAELFQPNAKGTACVSPGECASGFCVDGFCCDTKCDGPCEACTATKKGSGVDGVCGSVAAGTDPRDKCPVDSGYPASCKADGMCDGAGACRVNAPSGVTCGASTCATTSSGAELSRSLCDGIGACVASKVACAPYACNSGGTACATSCAVDTDCASSHYCDGSACAPKKSNGAVATASRECASGIVADGVCCNGACGAICEACDVEGSKGTCSPVVDAPRHGTCPVAGAGEDACKTASCDGSTRTECKKFVGADVECRAAACADGVETVATRCDGTGVCPALVKRECGAYACDGPRCRTTCRSAVDCAPNHVCDEIERKCLSASTCDGDHTIVAPNGSQKDCSPFKCDRARCLEACTATAQCVAGFVCDGTTCVRALAEETGDEGGCAFGASRRGSWLVMVILAAGAAFVRRRRRNPTLRAM